MPSSKNQSSKEFKFIFEIRAAVKLLRWLVKFSVDEPFSAPGVPMQFRLLFLAENAKKFVLRVLHVFEILIGPISSVLVPNDIYRILKCGDRK